MEIYQFLWPPQPQRRNRRGMTFRVHPEVALVIWSYLDDDLEDMISVYDTCKAWRERCESSPTWGLRKEQALNTTLPEDFFPKRGTKAYVFPKEESFRTVSQLLQYYKGYIRSCGWHSWKSSLQSDPWIATHTLKCLMNEVRKDSRKQTYQLAKNIYTFHVESCKREVSKVHVIRFVKLCGMLLEYVGEKWQKDPDVVWAAVTANGFAIQFVSK
eukprot:PhF_6_TR12566/c0_g1_i4/m.19697